MPDRHLIASAESDTRFQYDIIKGLADSIRQLTGSIQKMQETQVNMLERLAVLEANRVGEVVAKVEVAVEAAKNRIDVLEADKNRRDGAAGAFKMIKDWAPFLAMLFSAACAAWLYGRSLGLTPAPPATAIRVQNSEPNVERTVGGKP